MARTPSTMLELGTSAPNFSLPWPGNEAQVSLEDFNGKPLLVIFSCNHCPYVIHILDSLTAFANDCQDRGVAVVMINANDVDNYADDSPQKMIELAQKQGFKFPYLYDATQQTAIAYRAACTPDFFLFDGSHQLVYRGQYDGARPKNDTEITGVDLKNAVTKLLAGEPQVTDQLPSMGCNIKWKDGNEPDYF